MGNSRIFAITLLTFLALATGCAHPPKVSYKFDSKADFGTFKTYAVQPTQSPTLDLRVLDGKPMAQVIQESIERELNAKGLHKVEDASADLLVRWVAQIAYDPSGRAAPKPGVDLSRDTTDSNMVLDSGPPGDDYGHSEIAEGGIRIDLVNAKSNHPVWRGGIAAVLNSSLPDPERIARINATIAALFANYPPNANPARTP